MTLTHLKKKFVKKVRDKRRMLVLKLKQVGKISAINLVMILLLMNLFGVDFCTSSSPVRVDGIQPYNSFKDYIWGGLGEQTNLKYGWNLTYIENLNGDAYPDLVIGTPWYDSGPVNDIGKIYIFYGKPNIGFDDINYTNADVTIIGDGVDNKFGWDVSDAGDINNDGINDLIVGAPGALQNRGRAYLFYGGTIPVGTSSATTVASRILIGKTVGGYYGSSVAGIGDINNDGYDDVAVGAPGADHVIITYGYKNKMILYPNIWDDDETSKGIIKFDKGCNNSITDSNTWGLDGDDDGWDWVDSFHDPTQLYGQTSPAPFDHANIYGPWEPDGPDADGRTFKNRTALEIMIGRNHTDLNPYINTTGWDAGASAGWGIEFNITSEMNNLILTNSTITLSFDYTFVDTNKLFHNTNNTRVPCMIRSRLWNSSNNKVYLGEFESARENVYYIGDQILGAHQHGDLYMAILKPQLLTILIMLVRIIGILVVI